MSLRIALALLPLLLATPHALSASPSKIEHLAWLAGCWQLDGQPPGAGHRGCGAALSHLRRVHVRPVRGIQRHGHLA